MHARRGGGDGSDVVDALRRLQDGVDQDRRGRWRGAPRAGRAAGRDNGCPTAPRPWAASPRRACCRPRRRSRMTSSSAQGELSALIRVQSPVRAEVVRLGHGDEALPRRRLGIDRNGVLEIAQHDVDLADQLRRPSARIFSICGGTKWIIRSNRTGKSRSGAGAPIARGLKNCRGSFIAKLSVDFWPGGTVPAAGKSDARTMGGRKPKRWSDLNSRQATAAIFCASDWILCSFRAAPASINPGCGVNITEKRHQLD